MTKANVAVAAALAAAWAWAGECWCWLQDPLADEADYARATNVLVRAAASGYNALVLSAGEHTYWQPEKAARVKKLDALAKTLGVEIVPSIWSMGHGCAVTYTDPDAIESTPVKGVRYKAKEGRAEFVPDEVFTGFEGAVATNSVRVDLTGKVKPYRTYRLSCRVRTQDVSPVAFYSVRANIFHGEGKEFELYDFPVKSTQDWTRYEWEFNTYADGAAVFTLTVNRALGVSGTCWVDSVRVVERPITRCLTSEAWMKPVVRSAATGMVYAEGRDYAPFPKMRHASDGSRPVGIRLLPGGAVAEGEELLVDAHVPAVQGSRQYSVCPSATALKSFWRRSAKQIDGVLHPKRWFFSVDEWRVANRCEKCRARHVSPGRLVGECVAEMAATVREVNPQAEVFAWADMLCPLENAGRDPYYCVDGSLADSWRYVPKDLVMVPWMNGRDVVKTTNWLMEHGFRCIAGGYYNHPDFSRDVTWRDACKGNPKFLGMMYTTWSGTFESKYKDLEAYARVVRGERSEEVKVKSEEVRTDKNSIVNLNLQPQPLYPLPFVAQGEGGDTAGD